MQNIRTLQLSREMWIFVAVTGLLSAYYLWSTMGEAARARAKPVEVTPAELKVGQVVDIAITLISADSIGLSCGSDQAVDGARCAFKQSGERQTEPIKPEDVIAPYMTSDNVLVMVPGLFTQPVLKKRVEDEPPTKFTREEMEVRRFVTTCKFKPVDRLKNFKVRWQPTAGWGDKDSAWVGRVTDCRMTGG